MTHSPAPGSLEDILERSGGIPSLHDFPGVDELLASFEALTAEHPDLISSRRIGTSRLDEPIPMYSIGSGPRSYLLFAGVHPNEPIGFRMLQHLAMVLVEDAGLRAAFDATWHIIPCIDPDGTRLNEQWYAAPSDRTFYARHFYRPAPDEQVEWTFPFSYKEAWFDRVLPETQALMRVIDEVQPHFMVSLHNAELGGVYFYLNEDVAGAVEALQSVPAALGLPLDTGEPETPTVRPFGTAVYSMISMREEYDFLAELGADPASLITSGESSSSYAARYGTVSLVAELPYWSHPDADDESPSDETYAAVLRRKADALTETGTAIQEILSAADLTLDTPFRRATEAFVPYLVVNGDNERRRADREDQGRIATRAEVFSNEDVVRCFRLRYGGMALRMLDAEVAAGLATARTRRAQARLSALFETWCAESAAQADLTALPIADLVGVQFGATLAVARMLIEAESDR
ncbi:M14 family zinc carboxypeptidase [Microbacterium sp. NPDC055903]